MDNNNNNPRDGQFQGNFNLLLIQLVTRTGNLEREFRDMKRELQETRAKTDLARNEIHNAQQDTLNLQISLRDRNMVSHVTVMRFLEIVNRKIIAINANTQARLINSKIQQLDTPLQPLFSPTEGKPVEGFPRNVRELFRLSELELTLLLTELSVDCSAEPSLEWKREAFGVMVGIVIATGQNRGGSRIPIAT